MRTLVAALAAAFVFGPPGITVTEVTGTPPTPGAVLAIVTTHHTEEEEADLSAQMISIRNGQQVARDLTVTKAEGKGRYGVTKQWDSGVAWVLVFTVKQGENGSHGSASSIVRVDATGRVQGIDKITSSNARGDRYNSGATKADIERAFGQLGIRVGH